MKTYDETIIRPLMTEKNSNAQANEKKYTFQISKKSTKIDVKRAIKELYGVDVNKVTIMLTPPKTRLVKRGRLLTKRPVMKKAIISLKGGKTIDPNKIKEFKSKK